MEATQGRIRDFAVGDVLERTVGGGVDIAVIVTGHDDDRTYFWNASTNRSGAYLHRFAGRPVWRRVGRAA